MGPPPPTLFAQPTHPIRIGFFGAGNWGTTVAGLVAAAVLNLPQFHSEVRIWARPEPSAEGDPRRLAQYINEEHVNIRYQPHAHLSDNLVAFENIEDVALTADVLVFGLPHQFLAGPLAQAAKSVKKSALAVSLIKGISSTNGTLTPLSRVISEELGIPCGVLMGPNIANEIAKGLFATAALSVDNICPKYHQLLGTAFSGPQFTVFTNAGVEAAELCGALKNIVAVGVGAIYGLDLGDNLAGAFITQGLQEMQRFIAHFAPDVKADMFAMCALGDLLATCAGGRNRRAGAHFASRNAADPGSTSWEDTETTVLGGQKVQGVGTAEDVHVILEKRGIVQHFPLFSFVHKFATGEVLSTDFKKEIPRMFEEASRVVPGSVTM